MIRQKFKQEIFTKPEWPRQEELSTSQAKNTMMQLNGQNLRLAAKNVRNSKTPGLHLSATHGEEAVGRLTPAMQAQEGPVQRDTLPLRLPLPDSKREGVNTLPRRPLKLAPLELPKEVKEAQKQKIKGIQLEAKAAARKLDTGGNEACPRKVKACVRVELAKAECAPPLSALTEPVKGQQQQRAAKAQILCASHIHQNGDRHLEEAASTGIPPPPVSSKPAPPSPAPCSKTKGARGEERACQIPGTLQETGRRRLRLRRAERLEEDQSKSNTSTGGLSSEEGKLTQGVQCKGQRAEKALREASRMLERASRRSEGPLQHPGNIEVSGIAIRRTGLSKLQGAAL